MPLRSRSATPIRVEVPRKLAPLLKPARYKGAHGGRGGAKSHFFAEQLLIRCYARTTRAVCVREVQNSIKESVKQLLIDKIDKLGLGSFFTVLEGEIRGRNGSLIIFKGMQSYNAQNIKSLEGYDIVWCEEAQTLSEISLRMLRPTIRKDGSELWFSWNPRWDTDAIDAFLRGANKPADAIVVEVNWNDNPWFPDVLRAEKDQDFKADPEMAEHVWGGGYEIITEGAYYARLIADAEREGRVGHYPYNPARKVVTAWDLGVDDYTAIWFIQDDGMSATIIDYYEASGDGADTNVATALPEVFAPPGDERWRYWSRQVAMAELGREQPYSYDRHYLPHDIASREWGAGGRSRIEIAYGIGLKPIHKGVAVDPAERVGAVRKLLPICRFNMTPRVELGLKRLRRYRRKWNDALGSYTTPLHDENSHGSDAFGEYAINCGLFPEPPPEKPKQIDTSTPTLNDIVGEYERNMGRGRRI